MTRKTASKTATTPAKGKSAAGASSPRPAARAAESPKAKASAKKTAAPKKAAPKKAAPKKAATKVSAKKATKASAATAPAAAEVKTAAAATPEAAPPALKGAAKVAAQIAANADAPAVLAHAEAFASDKPTAASGAARVLDELVAQKPEMVVPIIDRFVSAVTGRQERTVQTAAAALPVMARIAPARVARHLPALTSGFERSTETGKDGLVSTFAALCTASVAYQKRLEPVLGLALRSADAKTLQRWTEIVLSSLKGEPHARARAVVEDRLGNIPRQYAQLIATFLGVKLRPSHLR